MMALLGDADTPIATRLRKEAAMVHSHSSDERIEIAIDHKFWIAAFSRITIPAATKSRPTCPPRRNTTPPLSSTAYASNGTPA
jgi:hypothetical protein